MFIFARRFVALTMVLTLPAAALAQGPGRGQGISISADLTQRLSDVLSQEWEGNPEWATMASEILAGREAMGTGNGWFKRTATKHDWAWLRKTFDTNPRDGQIQRQELPKSVTDQQFGILDRDMNGVISSRDLSWDKNPIMDTYSPSNDVFNSIDGDANGRLSRDELNDFFDRYAGGFEYLTPDDLRRGLKIRPAPRIPQNARRGAIPMPQRWQLFDFLLSGGMGSLTEGPDVGEDAPNFRLPLLTKDKENHELKLSKERIRLSDSKGTRPVVLIFGSFT